MKAKKSAILLLISFIVTIMEPLTGVMVHKLASTLFLILCIIHAVRCRKKMDVRKYALLGMLLLSFISGIFGMIYDEVPIILEMYKAITILFVFVVPVHMFLSGGMKNTK